MMKPSSDAHAMTSRCVVFGGTRTLDEALRRDSSEALQMMTGEPAPKTLAAFFIGPAVPLAQLEAHMREQCAKPWDLPPAVLP